VTATSSNPALIPNPTVSYTSPNSTGSLTFTPVANAFGTATLTVTVNDGGASNNIISRSFTVTVNAPPLITAQPQSQTVSPGATVTFSVTASGSAPLSYQWRFNGAPIAAATNSSLTLNNVQSSDAGLYSVVVSNAFGTALSSNATLTVSLSNAPPSITAHPLSQTVAQGANATFSVTAVGTTPLHYQWRFNGVDLPGATANSFTRTSAQPAHEGQYSVLVSNAFGVALSSNATLTVIVPPTITAHPQSLTVNQGSNATFSVTATGTLPLAYQWRKNGVALSDGGRISGATTPTLVISNVIGSDAASYDVIVSNGAGPAYSAAAQLWVSPAITAQPLSRTNVPGTTATFSVAADGQSPLFYRWRRDGNPLSDGANITGTTTPTLQIGSVSSADAGAYSVVVSNAAGAVTSVPATLTIAEPPLILTPVSYTHLT
ncbi:MAG: immunoglobulin domain-containing protein, partial [Verrucomicrobiae bacterium]|nr:immunoglobulin domain-containing protein [Verrucomicrobiae bacterium]